ncbi:MAG: zinc ribbon domain-containing protein [Lachnospiraceae bacterium]|nr:zinc ribbon domain-containing protein [Lachnospiraceae bacterium]
MERICSHCGTPLEDNALFCPECGERVTEAPAEAWLEEAPAAAAEAPAPEPAPEPAYAAPAPATPVAPPVKPVQHAAPAPKAGESEGITVFNKPLSTAVYFWTLFLFLLPGIGLIAMLIMAFTAKNQNRRNFAQACLIYVLIALILLGLFMLVLVVSGKSFGIDISKFSFKVIWEGILQGIGFVK